jgi:cell division transport system permease protein
MTFLRTTWHHIRRSPYQALAAVLIMMLTFFVISIFAFITYGSSKIILYFESKPQVTAFFKNDAKQENIEAVKKQVESTGKIAKIKFVSKEEALQIYKEQNKNDPLLLELVTSDILPASLEISTKDIEDLAKVSDSIKNSPYISEVVFQKDVVSKLTEWTGALRKVGFAFIVVLLLDSVFIMVTIIGIRIAQRREEIEIMRLLGATSWYVRWPFIFEGMFYGVTSAFFGWVVAAIALLYATPYLISFLGNIAIFPIPLVHLFALLGIEFLFAMILGAFSSFLAVLRYLK